MKKSQLGDLLVQDITTNHQEQWDDYCGHYDWSGPYKSDFKGKLRRAFGNYWVRVLQHCWGMTAVVWTDFKDRELVKVYYRPEVGALWDSKFGVLQHEDNWVASVVEILQMDEAMTTTGGNRGFNWKKILPQ
jgi:hypothetical protein